MLKPIQKSVKAKRHTRQYQMHKYFARRPYNVFSNLINHYSKEEDIVLDVFCGGGVTIFESLALNRKPIGVDLNPLATFITKMQIYKEEYSDFINLMDSFIDKIDKKYKDIYYVKFEDDEGYMEWMEWAYQTKCPHCSGPIILSQENKVSNGYYSCNNLDCFHEEKIKRLDTIPDGKYPIRIKYKSTISGEICFKDASELLNTVNVKEFNQVELDYIPNIEIPMDMDRQYEDRLEGKGVINYSDFFTERNYWLNVYIYNEILKMQTEVSKSELDILFFLFSSSLRYTNNMTRVTKNWEGGNPTSMDRHAFWLPNQFVETNVIDVLNKRKKAIERGLDYSKNNLPEKLMSQKDFEGLLEDGNYLILNQSSSSLPIPDKSVDVIITDPPYGSNVQYAELSLIWNVWLEDYKKLDDHLFREEEAVMNRRLPKNKGAKDDNFYEEMLFKVFKESHRVLKDDSYLVFTFNNKDINVWIAMLKSVARAGFYLPSNGILFQDYINSYKNTAHLKNAKNIHGDFIYSFAKRPKDYEIDTKHECLESLLKDSIKKVLTELLKDESEFIMTDLYQVIFSEITSSIMDYILVNLDSDEEINQSLSKNFIDTEINKYMIFEDDIWRRR